MNFTDQIQKKISVNIKQQVANQLNPREVEPSHRSARTYRHYSFFPSDEQLETVCHHLILWQVYYNQGFQWDF